MFNLLSEFWNWLKNSALHQLIFVLLCLILSFAILLKYPLSLEIKRVEVKDLIEVDADTTYVIHSEITEEGAKLFVTTNTYFTKVSKNVQ